MSDKKNYGIPKTFYTKSSIVRICVFDRCYWYVDDILIACNESMNLTLLLRRYIQTRDYMIWDGDESNGLDSVTQFVTKDDRTTGRWWLSSGSGVVFRLELLLKCSQVTYAANRLCWESPTHRLLANLRKRRRTFGALVGLTDWFFSQFRVDG